jgi:hypothetical protein
MLERVSRFVPRVSAVDATIVNTSAQPRVLIAAGVQVWPLDLRFAAAANTRPGRWIAEPWLATPIRIGNYVARVQEGAVVVYRYTQTAVF